MQHHEYYNLFPQTAEVRNSIIVLLVKPMQEKHNVVS